MPDVPAFHPFRCVLPVLAVPAVPETVDCVFDDAAVEMQKNIMKVVRVLLKRDRARVEDFKINARLFGNGFMEPREYFDTLVTDFGGLRALQLVPYLLSIYADFTKHHLMLVAAENYRVRNMAKLQLECDKQASAAAAASVDAKPIPAAKASFGTPARREPQDENRPVPGNRQNGNGNAYAAVPVKKDPVAPIPVAPVVQAATPVVQATLATAPAPQAVSAPIATPQPAVAPVAVSAEPVVQQAPAPVAKPAHSSLLFGLATAYADSDSDDDEEFSD